MQRIVTVKMQVCTSHRATLVQRPGQEHGPHAHCTRPSYMPIPGDSYAYPARAHTRRFIRIPGSDPRAQLGKEHAACFSTGHFFWLRHVAAWRGEGRTSIFGRLLRVLRVSISISPCAPPSCAKRPPSARAAPRRPRCRPRRLQFIVLYEFW